MKSLNQNDVENGRQVRTHILHLGQILVWVSLIFLSIMFPDRLTAQQLKAGPVLFGESESSLYVWLMTRDTPDDFPSAVHYNDVLLSETEWTSFCHKGACVYTIRIPTDGENPEQGRIVLSGEGQITIDPVGSKGQDDEFQMFIGSCAFNWSQFGRLFLPGNGFRIFRNMQQVEADAMLWLGDNVYYMFRQSSSAANMFKKQSRIRNHRLLLPFMSSLPQYAIWDDHDFGPNNSNSTFDLRDTAVHVFRSFWPGPYVSEEGQGNYYSFRRGAVEMFLLDNRYFRTPEEEPEGYMLGEEQMAWLRSGLSASDAPFKILVSGSQSTISAGTSERFTLYPKEHGELMEFLRKERVEGVLFLSGDVHYSSLFRTEGILEYPLYEYTSSPLSSFPNKLNTKQMEKLENMMCDTYFSRQNFGRISVGKDREGHFLVMELYNKKAELQWKQVIREKDLRIPR